MNELIKEIFLQIFTYSFVVVAFYVFLNFMSHGFLARLVGAKTARGRKLLIQVLNPVSDYFIHATLDGGMVVLRDNECKKEGKKSVKRVSLASDKIIKKVWGVPFLVFDPEKNCFLNSNLEGVPGFDAIKHTNLLTRALMAPVEPKNYMIFFIIIIIALLALLVFDFVLFSKIKELIPLINSVKAACSVVALPGVV